MRQMVIDSRIDLQLRQIAISATYANPSNDHVSDCSSICGAVQAQIKYVSDVLDVETLAAPLHVWNMRVGDCDDIACLVASLFESIGIKTRFVVAGYNGNSQPEHVYVQVLIDTEWYSCDASEKRTFGWCPPNPSVIYVEAV